MKFDQIFSGFNMSAMGMSFQRRRMNVIAENLANAETTRSSDGSIYRRKLAIPKFPSIEDGFVGFLKSSLIKLDTTNESHFPLGDSSNASSFHGGGDLEVDIVQDETEPLMEYNPSHPEADSNGFVKKPNVNLFNEMVDMISASKGFEANVVAINAAKSMAKDSLEI